MKTADSNAALFTRTLKLKVKREAYAWLNAAAIEVNQVWNWANATSMDAADRNRRAHAKCLSGFDLDKLSAGASACFERINSACIQRINSEYATKRRLAKRLKLRWRVSRGARRSLGWVPFKAANLKRKGVCLRFAGKCVRVFERQLLENAKWRDGCFAQDAVGDWWLCLPIRSEAAHSIATREAVGIDLGVKAIATTSEGESLHAGRWTHFYANKLASAQRRGHKRQAKRIHRKAARCRADALHRGMLKTQLLYKSQQAGRSVQIVSERNTSVTCSSCGSLSGPRGVNGLIVRSWICSECGDSHDRDVNAARNILIGSRCRTSVSGNEPSPVAAASGRISEPRKTYWLKTVAA